MKRWIILVMLALASTAAQAETAPSILNPSGLPIPRFVSLKSDNVNVRVGPGERYPIRWSYHRARLPVEIIEEFAHWRRIKDYEGATGWVHKSVVDGKRTVMILDKSQSLYAKPDVNATQVMRAQANVIGFVKACQPDWCRIDIQDHKAWIRKADIWGVTREEVFDE